MVLIVVLDLSSSAIKVRQSSRALVGISSTFEPRLASHLHFTFSLPAEMEGFVGGCGYENDQ